MHIVNLLREMEAALREVFSEDVAIYKTRNNDEKKVLVRRGWEVARSEVRAPEVLLSPVKISHDGEGWRAKISIIAMAYDRAEDGSGWEDVALMLERVRDWLLSGATGGVISPIPTSVEVSFPDEMPYPLWLGELKVDLYLLDPLSWGGKEFS